MDNVNILARAQELVDLAGVPIKRDLRISYANRFFHAVGDAVRELGPSRLPHWAKEWAPQFRGMVDRFDQEAERDPMIQYTPAHRAAEEYHRSWARRLYAKCANAVGKTQMGFAEDYRILTHQDPHRKYEDVNTPNMALASLDHSGYGVTVFEAKLINGETDNYLSPIFPEGGKWLHKYDRKTRTIWIKCPKCANDKRQPICKEPVFFRHFSMEGGWEGFQGAFYAAVHIDEHVPEEFYEEAKIRVERNSYIGRIFITGTPLFGRNAWEIKQLQAFIKKTPPELNRITLRGGEVVPIAEMIKITQEAAGFKTKEQIEKARLELSPSKFKARYLGEEVPDVKNAVYEDAILELQETFCRDPMYGDLELITHDEKGEPILQGPYDPNPGQIIDDLGLDDPKHLRWVETSAGKDPDIWTGYRIWEMPIRGGVDHKSGKTINPAQYIMGVDVAAGLSQETHDASCCHVLKIYLDENFDLCVEQVAQYYGWINPLDLGVKVKRLGVFYNNAMAVVEITGGLGQSHIFRLKELGYPRIFRNTRDPAHRDNEMDPRLGVDTNVKTKPIFISASLKLFRETRIRLRDKETIFELRSFIQRTTDSGTVKFEAADSAHDDRVTALLFACFAVIHFPLAVYESQEEIEAIQESLTDVQRAQNAIQAAMQNWDSGTNRSMG